MHCGGCWPPWCSNDRRAAWCPGLSCLRHYRYASICGEYCYAGLADAVIGFSRRFASSYTRRPNDRLFGDAPVVPAQAGIHDLPSLQQRKPWMPGLRRHDGE